MERRPNRTTNNHTTTTMESEETVKLIHQTNLKGDWSNIALLLFLYTLQGIPIGMCASIPMILQNYGASYKQQAQFSLVMWPFSLKLLWAPLVDTFFSHRLGRRKTWLIPTQYLIGVFMLALSTQVDSWLTGSTATTASLNIGLLTLVFFAFNFLAATQDIAVDGWALTMLRKSNVGHASTCNSVGQTAGYFLSYQLFMALESSSFCNSYLRSTPSDQGLVTLSGFLYFWGWVFLVTTTLVALFKRETDTREHGAHQNVQLAYNSLRDILSLKPVQTLSVVLLTCKIGFSAMDSVMALKLIESGIPKERLGLIAIPLIPLQLIMPLIIAKYTTGARPLNVFLKAFPYRLLFGIIAAVLVWFTPSLVPNPSTSGLPIFYILILISCYALHQVCVYSMFVSAMAFFARISDSSVGGTYMTLLNTLMNLGGNWPAMLALYFVDPLTWKKCEGGAEAFDNTCRNELEQNLCLEKGGKCVTWLDGFYIETLICTLIGFGWFLWGRKKMNYVQSLEDYAWKLTKRHR